MTRAIAAAVLVTAAWLAALPAAAEEKPRFCPNSPSLQSSSCTTEPGHVQVEVTAIDWELDRDAGTRTDTFLAADTLVRVGIGAKTEVQFDWTPYGVVRERDGDTGEITRRGRVGDLTFAVRQNVRHVDGKGLSFGFQPYVTLPVGRAPVGSGTWSAGLIAPANYHFNDTVSLGGTAEIDAQADEDGHGRHVAASGVAAMAFKVGQMTFTAETQITRDDDPAGATTQWVGGLGMLAKVSKRRAFYAEAVTGLNRDAPDVRLYCGIAMLF